MEVNGSSLEVSSSTLGAQVVRPQFVRDLDLIDKVWPAHLRPKAMNSGNPSHAPVALPNANNTASNIYFPKVTLYCLMSVSRSYTDFHVDFGGSSVFYHILKGNKTFLFIEPNPTNLRRYEAWCSDSDQSRRFLGEEVKECIRVDLAAGDTMIIPSGWIHAVYTPTDSLVLGGNFLTPLHIPSQLNIANIETRTRVPKKFRFPFFDMAMWYTALYYLDTYIPRRKRGPPPKSGRRNTEGMSDAEITGLKALAEWLWRKSKLRTQQIAKGVEYRTKVEVPPGLDVVETAVRYAKWVYGDGEGENAEDLPGWYRNEVLNSKVESSRKRKREDGGEVMPRKGLRRNAKRDRMEEQGVEGLERTSKKVVEYVRIERSVTSYASISGSLTRPVMTTLIWYEAVKPAEPTKAPSRPMNIFKPYSSEPVTHLSPSDNPFMEHIKWTCRPYIRPSTAPLLEEIKVEDEPLGGLDALTRAVELATQPHQYAAPPSSSGSSLTVFSASPEHPRLRLPTPPSQSPSPMLPDPLMTTFGRRRRAWSEEMSTPKKKSARSSPQSARKPRPKDEETESRRLMGLLTDDELKDLRKRRRRGATYVFGLASLRRELTRLGRKF